MSPLTQPLSSKNEAALSKQAARLAGNSSTDFFHALQDELDEVQKSLLRTIQSSNGTLSELAAYYAARPSKRMRPRLILLIAQATATEPNHMSESHLRLAEIVEMIHVASLLHDDVLDKADLRRGDVSAPAKYGNKNTILTGDFLLAKLMSLTVSLGSWEVAQEIPAIISELVEGELRQAEGANSCQETSPHERDSPALWKHYLHRIYLKTASLFARSGRCAVLLHKDVPKEWVESAYEYGRNLGIAFQIVDDILDFVGDESLGKPCNGNDLRSGIITAPVLFALEESPEMQTLLDRGFSEPGDIEKAISIVHSTNALQRSQSMAMDYAKQARLNIENWEPSDAKNALEALSRWITVRKN